MIRDMYSGISSSPAATSDATAQGRRYRALVIIRHNIPPPAQWESNRQCSWPMMESEEIDPSRHRTSVWYRQGRSQPTINNFFVDLIFDFIVFRIMNYFADFAQDQCFPVYFCHFFGVRFYWSFDGRHILCFVFMMTIEWEKFTG